MRHTLSLRSSIFASYLFLLIITLGVIIVAMLFLFSTRPEPDSAAFQRLANVLNRISLDDVADEYFQRNPDASAVSPANLYRSFAEWNDVRVIILNSSNGAVQFDSTGQIARLTRLSLQRSAYTLPVALARLLPSGYEVLLGRFVDAENGEWLYAGLVDTSRMVDRALIVADQRDTERSLSSALAEFSSALAVPMMQAAFVGMVIAFVLAALIARTIARPLQHFANAAQSIAQGHYEQRVPVEGAAEMRAAADAFNRMSAEVHATQQAQRDFLANVSHDLKTPLTSIQGYAQAITDGTSKDPSQAAAIIYDESARLSRMVSELTDLARLQAGGILMRADSIDLVPLWEVIKQRMEVMIQRKRLTFTLTLPASLIVEGDGDRLAQVFTNLLSNAIKYTPEGGSIAVTLATESSGALITVSDTGIGIPNTEQPRIFERFYQVDKTRGPERGTGLGLAIAREIVQAHQGRITVQSGGSNQGTTFTIWLPKNKGGSA